jgi:hypothetical protein
VIPHATTLRQCGEALYGSAWQSELSRALGLCSSRRLRAWLAGDRQIPPGVWADLAALMRKRGEALVALAESLKEDTK